jgi:predicted XRE-type DNA-binding protein
MKAARRDFEDFPDKARDRLLDALTVVAEGGMPPIAKPLSGFGSGVLEVALAFRGDGIPRRLRRAARRRCVGDPCLPEEVEDRDQDAETRNRPDPCAAAPPEGDVAMTDDDMEIVRGSGNVFRDFGYPDADVRQAKALLAAQVIKVLDAEKLSTRQAEAKTGVAHSEFVRIRNVNLARFTIDRLVTILGRLGQEVEFTFTVHPRTRREAEPDTAHL